MRNVYFAIFGDLSIESLGPCNDRSQAEHIAHSRFDDVVLVVPQSCLEAWAYEALKISLDLTLSQARAVMGQGVAQWS